MAAYRLVDDCLYVHRDQLRAQRSVSSMGSLYLYLFTYVSCFYLCGLLMASQDAESISDKFKVTKKYH